MSKDNFAAERLSKMFSNNALMNFEYQRAFVYGGLLDSYNLGYLDPFETPANRVGQNVLGDYGFLVSAEHFENNANKDLARKLLDEIDYPDDFYDMSPDEVVRNNQLVKTVTISLLSQYWDIDQSYTSDEHLDDVLNVLAGAYIKEGYADADMKGAFGDTLMTEYGKGGSFGIFMHEFGHTKSGGEMGADMMALAMYEFLGDTLSFESFKTRTGYHKYASIDAIKGSDNYDAEMDRIYEHSRDRTQLTWIEDVFNAADVKVSWRKMNRAGIENRRLYDTNFEDYVKHIVIESFDLSEKTAKRAVKYAYDRR